MTHSRKDYQFMISQIEELETAEGKDAFLVEYMNWRGVDQYRALNAYAKKLVFLKATANIMADQLHMDQPYKD